MKATKEQKEMIDCLISQAKFWASSNDIASPTHYNDIAEEVNKLDFLCEEDAERFILAIEQVYHLIKITGLC